MLQSTRRPFKSMDLALSCEVNRQGQRNRAICDTYIVDTSCVQYSSVQNLDDEDIMDYSIYTPVYQYMYYMSLIVRKPVLGVSDLVRHKLGCSATEDG